MIHQLFQSHQVSTYSEWNGWLDAIRQSVFAGRLHQDALVASLCLAQMWRSMDAPRLDDARNANQRAQMEHVERVYDQRAVPEPAAALAAVAAEVSTSDDMISSISDIDELISSISNSDEFDVNGYEIGECVVSSQLRLVLSSHTFKLAPSLTEYMI